MYTHSYSFNTDICLHIHSAECTVRLLNQAGRNNYPYNPKYVGNTGNLWIHYFLCFRPWHFYRIIDGKLLLYNHSVYSHNPFILYDINIENLHLPILGKELIMKIFSDTLIQDWMKTIAEIQTGKSSISGSFP